MDTFKNFFNYIINKNVGRHSQALSFATVLCIVPIITIFIGFIGSSNIFFNINSEINIFFNSYLFPKQIAGTFNEYFKVFSEQATHLKLVGIIFFIISILLLFSDMQNSFSDLLSDSEYESVSNNTFHKKVTTLFTLFFAPVVVFCFIGFFNWITSFNIFIIGNMLDMIVHHNIMIKTFIFVILWFWYSFLFYLLPAVKMRLKYILIGSTIATVVFVCTQVIFSYYLSKFATYELIYGVFSIIPIFFLWIYVIWQITLYSLLIAHFLDKDIKMEKNQDLAS